MVTTLGTKSEQALSDFGLVAALLSSGFKIRRTSKTSRRVFFIFEQTEKLESAIDQYMLGDLQVGARQYFEATKQLKSLIYGEWQNGSQD